MKSSVCKQKDLFLGAVKTVQDLLLTSYRLSHHILKRKKPFTLGEEVIKPALQIVAEQLLSKENERKFQNIPLSDTNASRRGFHMAHICWNNFCVKSEKFLVMDCNWMNQLILGEEHNCLCL